MRPGDGPAACNWAGTSRADTPVVTLAVTIAAAAQIVLRSAAAARRLAAARKLAADGAAERAGIRSRPSAMVIKAKPAAAASRGIASPKDWTSAPEAAGPATPPTPALATDPLRPDPAGPVLAIQDNPAVHTTP